MPYLNTQVPKKKWNLDEDGSDEEDTRRAAAASAAELLSRQGTDDEKAKTEVKQEQEEDEVDPLDAFMQVRSSGQVTESGHGGTRWSPMQVRPAALTRSDHELNAHAG